MTHYSFVVQWSEEDQAYIAKSPEFPYMAADGETPQAAIDELQIALEGAIEVYKAKGWSLPEPQVMASA
jgi:predicted RNase H-like HicB family nuclease